MALALIALTLVAGGAWLLSRGETTEEDRIRALLGEMEEAVEDKNVASFVNHLTEGFTLDFEQGLLTRGELRMMLAGVFFRNKQGVSVALREIEVQVEGDEATATLLAGVAEGPELKAGIRPDRAWSMEVRLVKDLEEDRWLIERTEARPIRDW